MSDMWLSQKSTNYIWPSKPPMPGHADCQVRIHKNGEVEYLEVPSGDPPGNSPSQCLECGRSFEGRKVVTGSGLKWAALCKGCLYAFNKKSEAEPPVQTNEYGREIR